MASSLLLFWSESLKCIFFSFSIFPIIFSIFSVGFTWNEVIIVPAKPMTAAMIVPQSFASMAAMVPIVVMTGQSPSRLVVPRLFPMEASFPVINIVADCRTNLLNDVLRLGNPCPEPVPQSTF